MVSAGGGRDGSPPSSPRPCAGAYRPARAASAERAARWTPARGRGDGVGTAGGAGHSLGFASSREEEVWFTRRRDDAMRNPSASSAPLRAKKEGGSRRGAEDAEKKWRRDEQATPPPIHQSSHPSPRARPGVHRAARSARAAPAGRWTPAQGRGDGGSGGGGWRREWSIRPAAPRRSGRSRRRFDRDVPPSARDRPRDRRSVCSSGYGYAANRPTIAVSGDRARPTG